MADEPDPKEPRAPQAMVIDLEAEPVVEDALPPPPLPPKKRRTKLWGAVAIAALAALGGGWLYRSYGASLWPTDAMVDLGSRVGAVESAAKTLDEQIKGLGGAVDGLKTDAAKFAAAADDASGTAKSAKGEAESASAAAAALAGRLDKAEAALKSAQSSIAAIQQSLAGGATGTAPVADNAALDALARRVADLEKTVAALEAGGPAGPDTQTAGLLSQSLSDLKAKIANGAPYTDELARIRGLVPAAPGLDELAANAAAGLPTAKALADQLAKLAPTLPGPETEAAPAEESAWNWFTSMLGGVVTIRDLGEPDWRDVAGKALAFAEAGDLAQAIGAVAAAEGEAPAALAAWLASARARVSGDAALEAVSAAVLRQIAALGGTP